MFPAAFARSKANDSLIRPGLDDLIFAIGAAPMSVLARCEVDDLIQSLSLLSAALSLAGSVTPPGPCDPMADPTECRRDDRHKDGANDRSNYRGDDRNDEVAHLGKLGRVRASSSRARGAQGAACNSAETTGCRIPQRIAMHSGQSGRVTSWVSCLCSTKKSTAMRKAESFLTMRLPH